MKTKEQGVESNEQRAKSKEQRIKTTTNCHLEISEALTDNYQLITVNYPPKR